MSFASAFQGTARGLFAGSTVRSAARNVGIIAGAGALAAAYQICYEEGKSVIHNMRATSATRHARNDVISLHLVKSGLPLDLQEHLRKSRDVFRTAMRIISDENIAQEHRDTLHALLMKLIMQQNDVVET